MRARHIGFYLAVLFIAGCSEPTGTLRGNVTFNGEPIADGTVVFLAENGQSYSAKVREGRYELKDVPPGLKKVTVWSHEPSPAQMVPTEDGSAAMAVAAPKAKYVRLPRKYQDADQSGLQHTVVAGEQKQDFELLP